MTFSKFPPRPSRTKIGAFVALLGAFAVACGGAEEKSSADPAQPEKSEAATPDSVPSGQQLTLFTDRTRGPSRKLAPYIEEYEAEHASRMSSGAMAEGQSALASFLGQLVRGRDERWSASLAPGFRCTTLRPRALDLVYEQGQAKVWRAAELDTGWREGDEALGSLRELHAPLAGAQRPRVELDVVGWRSLPDGGVELETLVVLFGTVEGQRVQLNLSLDTRWTRGAEEEPRLAEAALRSYEQVSLGRPLFGDLTSHAFGGHPFFPGEFMLGVDDYLFRRDQLGGSAFLGAHGLAVGDVNGDGLDDLFVAQQGGLPNRLFLHLPDGRTEDVSAASGLNFLDAVRGALLVDLDADGDQDLAMGVGRNVLIVYNDGRGRFSSPVLLEGSANDNVFSLCAADPDEDGDLDLYACHYIFNDGTVSTLPLPYHDANNGSRNIYWRNDGGGVFTDATKEVGLDVNNERFSLSAIWEDLDQDGDIDLYVTNDFGRNNDFRNDGGHFTDIAESSGALDMAAGMGATTADYDRDGVMDLYVSNMFMPEGMCYAADVSSSDEMLRAIHGRFSRGNTLLRGQGDGSFDDVSLLGGAARGGWTWGAIFTEFDNDGWPDLYVPNGFVTGWGEGDVDTFHWRGVVARSPKDSIMTEDYQRAWGALEFLVMERGASYAGNERNRVYLNTRDGRFSDIGAASGADFLEDARATARLDWDGDGQLDLVLKNRTAPRLRLLRNQAAEGAHFLQLDLVGTKGHPDAIGARVVVRLGEKNLQRSLHAGEGYLAQSSKCMHFGLGDAEHVDELSVQWPGGDRESFQGIEVDGRYRLVEGSGRAEAVERRSIGSMESKTTAPLAPRPGSQVDRVVLVERLPLGPFEVPGFDDPERKLAAFDGLFVLLEFFKSGSEDCVTEIGRLQRKRAELDAAGVFVVPLSFDEPEDLPAARALLEGAGLLPLAGHLDEKQRLPFEVVLSEVFRRSAPSPAPTSFLIDREGKLAVIYLGPVRVPQLLADVEIMKGEPAGQLSGSRLLGGEWLVPRQRDVERLVNAMAMLGLRDLGRHFFEFGESR